MNFKLILALSLFGLFMAIGTVYFIPPGVIEPICWLIIFLICAYFIAKYAPGKYFLHGLCTSLVNCIYITGVHVLLFTKYAAGHAMEMDMSNKMSTFHGHPRQQMLLIGPMIGILSGIILGLFAFSASKIVKKA